MSLLEVRDLTVRDSLTGALIVRDVHFCLEPGTCLGVVGESGSGKTHLLRALANELVSFNRASIFFCTPEELKTHYDITKNQRRARQRILAHKALVVDDLQKIYNMPGLQDELILLFDALHEDNKQLVFAGIHKPGEAKSLDERLRSRLEGGLCLAIKEADLEVRIQYITGQCAEMGLNLNKSQVLTLAARFEGLRQLKGIIKRLSAYSSLTQRELLESDFESMVRHAGGKTLPEVTSSQIINITAGHMDLSPADILGGKRTQDVVLARHISMYLCRLILYVCVVGSPSTFCRFALSRDRSGLLAVTNFIF